MMFKNCLVNWVKNYWVEDFQFDQAAVDALTNILADAKKVNRTVNKTGKTKMLDILVRSVEKNMKEQVEKISRQRGIEMARRSMRRKTTDDEETNLEFDWDALEGRMGQCSVRSTNRSFRSDRTSQSSMKSNSSTGSMSGASFVVTPRVTS